METNVKRIFLANYEDFENCYIFSPSIGRKKIDGKTYRVTRYFNGNRDFEASMKKFATTITKTGDNHYETEKIHRRTVFQAFPR